MSEAGDSGPRISRVVVAGGGTAGWTVAAALVKALGRLLTITVVESDQIGTVGVGESTIPTARRFHELLGIDEKTFVQATNASFKLGIKFQDWLREGESYFHSFGTSGRSNWLADFHHIWLRARELELAEEYGAYCLEHHAALSGKFACGAGSGLNYAYHLDATSYGGFLRQHAEANGVLRREGRIARVRRDGETGDIAALEMEDGEAIEGDLFVDCTGFRALLIGETLEVPFADWTHWLGCDRALAVQTEPVGPPPPYTRARAHRAGWQWRIPLQNRVGNGLVYASERLSECEAQSLLRERTDGAYVTEPRLIRFRTGMRRTMWERNCIAIGLTGGFVEPLESTSIHLIMTAAIRLLQLFPFDGMTAAGQSRFNVVGRREMEHIRDFIVLHYHLNRRQEPFWREAADMEIPDTLTARIEAFAEGAIAWQEPDELFRIDSWVQVMLGQGIVPSSHHAFARMMERETLAKSLAGLSGNIRSATSQLPDHGDFLSRYPAG
ncbi:tryptophan halogenase family protein [Aurantiacibacter spongiae]|uniref:Tryptophan 7-halogenase n=1 Tax=Aurantiacibacter spongiae TaxID=2488860 RepID=A0A3N5DMQ1_9SPHN|nr:tryptophan halogenase family protein [Aurantiacibacter spongiae]RPF72165.1 tryptophan 7-halogenase [Aurantiacibacter spongiae]